MVLCEFPQRLFSAAALVGVVRCCTVLLLFMSRRLLHVPSERRTSMRMRACRAREEHGRYSA